MRLLAVCLGRNVVATDQHKAIERLQVLLQDLLIVNRRQHDRHPAVLCDGLGVRETGRRFRRSAALGRLVDTGNPDQGPRRSCLLVAAGRDQDDTETGGQQSFVHVRFSEVRMVNFVVVHG